MAINVKKLKRVIQVNEPLKVLNSGDKKPAFRQNGYGLTLDSANSDFVLLNNTTQINEVSEVSFSIDANIDLSVVSSKQLFSVGTVVSGRGLISLWINSAKVIQLDVFDINATVITKVGGLVDGSESYVFDGVKLYKNGIEIIDLTSEGVIDINLATTEDVTLGRLSYSGSRFVDGSIKSFSYLGEQFNLEESRGTTTTGSNGTIATINTINAGGVQYLDSTVWNKKSFALIGEPLDDEKVTILGVEYPLSATPITEIEHLGEIFSLKEGLGNQVYGDGGTIGIISTDNVLGIERINFGMWLKGDDTNGWSPYT